MTVITGAEIIGFSSRRKFSIGDIFERRTVENSMRLFGCFGLAIMISTASAPYKSGLTWLAKRFAYNFELQQFDRCAREGEKIIRINDEEVLFARDATNFESRPCPISKG